MSRTPWNWIITAFVLAAMFLTSFGMYRKEVKSSNPLKIIELQKEIRRKRSSGGIPSRGVRRKCLSEQPAFL